MILRNSQSRKARNKQKQSQHLMFEKLEDRKMMAADLSSHNTMSNGLSEPVIQHVMPQDTNVHSARMEMHGCDHHADPAVMALVADSAATHVAIGSGNWSDPSVWRDGVVPAEGARVVIAANQTVTVDGVLTDSFKTVRIDGTLNFATDVNTQLKVDTLVSMHCGRLQIGTQANPVDAGVSARIIFADDGAIDLRWDPTQVSRGAILMGTTELYGAETTDKVSLAVQPVAGATQIQLSAIPTNWKPGDQIVITGTQGETSDEVRTITSIDGTNIRLNEALVRDHQTPKSNLKVHVANKTRNIEFRSENTEISRRGHIMFAHTQNVSVNHVAFQDLGRTDKSRDLDDVFFEFEEDRVGNEAGAPVHFTTSNGERTNVRGRYAVHFHRGGVDPNSTAATVHGSVVNGSPGWGFVNHSSHVHFTSNVAYGVWGAAYYTEAGDEIGSFDGNIAIRTVNPRSPVDPESLEIAVDLGHDNQEFGNSGDGFWLSGHLVSVTNNISSGSSGHGIIIWSDGLVEHDLGDQSGRTTVKTSHIKNGELITDRDSIPVWWAPLAAVSNNEVSGSVIGFRTRYIHSKTYLGEGGSDFHKTPPQQYVDTLNPVIDGLKSWGNREGVMMNYSERISLKNAEIIGIGEPFRYQDGTTNVGVGLDLGTAVSRGSGRLENISIEGFGMGFVAPRNDQWTMDNMMFKNTTDMLIHETRMSPRTFTMSNFEFGSLDGTAVANTSGSRRNIVFHEVDFTDGSAQPYFFLLPDHITLDGQGIYSDNQAANFIPLRERPDGNPIEVVPTSYVGRTNQQLQNQFGLSFGGSVIPDDARSVSWVSGGKVGTAAPAATRFPKLFDMTSGGDFREPFPGGPIPELTGNRLEIRQGETVTFMVTNLNTTDTDTSFEGLTYTASEVKNGFFAHRDAPNTPINRFTQADVNGGVIRFVHNGSGEAPDYRVRVSDGTTTTGWSTPMVVFEGGTANPNRSPIANDDSADVFKNQSVPVSVLTNDRDPDGDPIRIQSFSQPANGTVVNNNGILTYSPNAGFVGNDIFTYTITDGELTDSATVSLTVADDGNNGQTKDIGYSGTVRVNHAWKKVTLSQTFENPVVVAGGASRNGGHPGVVRVRNVTENSFEIRFQEWDYLDGRHAFEDIGYLVVEAGTHQLTDGTTLVAGTVELIHERVASVDFATEFSDTPVMISQIMTNNGGAAVTDRLRSVDEAGFRIQMSEEEAADHRHNRELVGWIAIDQGSASSGETSLTAMLDDRVNHNTSVIEFGDLDGAENPVVLTDMQTRRGGDNATVRHRGQTAETVAVFLEEERSENDEIRHTYETVGLLAFEAGVLVAKADQAPQEFVSPAALAQGPVNKLVFTPENRFVALESSPGEARRGEEVESSAQLNLVGSNQAVQAESDTMLDAIRADEKMEVSETRAALLDDVFADFSSQF